MNTSQASLNASELEEGELMYEVERLFPMEKAEDDGYYHYEAVEEEEEADVAVNATEIHSLDKLGNLSKECLFEHNCTDYDEEDVDEEIVLVEVEEEARFYDPSCLVENCSLRSRY